MKRASRLTAVVAILALMTVSMTGCPGQQVNQYQTNITIDKEFTTLAEQYDVWYKAADPATQARWKANIDPIFRKADIVLDAYQNVILVGANPDTQITELRKLKTQILTELAKKYQ